MIGIYIKDHELGVHFWGPLFNDIPTTGGPMLIKTRSHEQHIQYTKISGENLLTQMITDPNSIKELQTVDAMLTG